MFLKLEKKKSGTYCRIVQSYRDQEGKSRHKKICNLGRLDQYCIDDLRKLVKSFSKIAGMDLDDLNLNPISEEKRLNYGLEYVIKKLLIDFGLKDILDKISSKNNKKVDMFNTCLLMLIERFRVPGSKLSVFKNQEKHFGFKKNNIPLMHLYRCLDYLDDNSSLIKSSIDTYNKINFKQTVNVVFYDVTTFYFDSQKVEENSIRQKGFSKDNKKTKTQIVFGLLIDKNKLPIDYFIYDGSQYEGHTLIDVMKSLRKKYNIKKSIVVTDTGMMNAENINFIQEKTNFDYIIGERFKNLPNKIKEEFLDLKNYKDLELEEKGEKIKIKYFTYYYKKKGKNLVFTYSNKRAKKDLNERERKIEKAKKLLEDKSQLSNKKPYFFIKQTTEKKYELDEKLIEESSKYDGIKCISTNMLDVNILELLDNYKHLYQIEHSFRTLKSYFEIRPMFHWTNKRIKGHVCLNYICYSILIYLQKKLSKEKVNLSEDDIRKMLNQMELSLIKQSNKFYYMRSKGDKIGEKVLKILDLKSLPKLIPEVKILEYLN